MSLNKKQVTLLKRVKRAILRNSEEFNMCDWVIRRSDECGSSACIGGWAAVITNQNKHPKELIDKIKAKCSSQTPWVVSGKIIDDFVKGADALGMSPEHPLFHANDWPKPFVDDYYALNLDDREGEAEIAAGLIDWFIDHPDWGFDDDGSE